MKTNKPRKRKRVKKKKVSKAVKTKKIAPKRLPAPPSEAAPADEHIEDTSAGPSIAVDEKAMLLALVEKAEPDLFYSGADQTGYITVQHDGHEETYVIGGRDSNGWLHDLFYTVYETLPVIETIRAATRHLIFQATKRGPYKPVYRRVAPLASGRAGVILDLGDDSRRQIRVTPEGWTVTPPDPDTKFIRDVATAAMVLPIAGESSDLDTFLDLLNLDPADRLLLVGWLTFSLLPKGPYPIAFFSGEQGSGKSWAGRRIQQLIDPSGSDLQAPPKSSRDCIIAASHGHLLAYDNLSSLSDAISDCLCRIATGAGWRARRLYTDSDEAIFRVQRPIMINSIEEQLGRADLLDRAVQFTFPIVEAYRAERDLDAEFARVAPRVMGYVLTLLGQALRERERGIIPDPEFRMADFAAWLTAIERAVNVAAGSIVEQYRMKKDSVQHISLEGAPFVPALIRVVEYRREGVVDIHATTPTSTTWTGSGTELLEQITETLKRLNKEHMTREAGFPRNAIKLIGILARLKPALRKIHGYHFGKSRNERSGAAVRKVFTIEVRRVAPVAVVAGGVRGGVATAPKGISQMDARTRPATSATTATRRGAK